MTRSSKLNKITREQYPEECKKDPVTLVDNARVGVVAKQLGLLFPKFTEEK